MPLGMSVPTSPLLAGARTAGAVLGSHAADARRDADSSLPSAMESILRETTQLTLGFRFDRYELLCPAGRGGMASVWVARLQGKHGFEKLVAIKTILPHNSHDLRFQRMFLDEARIASGIEQVNVARILDLGEQQGLLYLVMEWIEGDSLAKLLGAVVSQGARMSQGVALRAVADACAGLHAAHELRDRNGVHLGVVHRDVSPQNILLSTEGVTKVIDFGIAKAHARIAGDTTDGALKGKLAYMSPEQAYGHEIDRRADVWSLGAVLYHLLAGTPPFKGETEAATFAFLTSGLPPQPLPADVPASVAEIVRRALGPLDRRYATAAELQRAIEAAMLESGLVTNLGDVGAYVQKYVGERVSARKTLVRQAIEEIDAREGGGATTASPWATHQPPAETPATAGARKRRARIGWIAAIGTAVLVTAGASVIALGRVPRGHAASSAPVGSVVPPPIESQPAIAAAEPSAAAPAAAPPPSSTSAAPAPPMNKTRRASPARPTPVAAPFCNPPYTIDSDGVRHYKRACIQ
jgi:eukaryotic-like serine/threonine-protein kinase